MKVWGAFLFVVLLAWTSVTAWAQTSTGVVTGTITDASGATLPGVTVKVTNQQTGAVRELITNELGGYRAVALPPSTYAVSAELTGFRGISRPNVTLPVASTVTVDFTLEVASVAESITVTEQAPLVETTENTVKTLIDSRRIEELPLKSRDFLDLTLLAPGVVTDQGSAAAGQTDSISFAGMSEQYKSIWLEGVDFNDEVTGGGTSLSSATRTAIAQEVIQEFQVMANSYSAEFGRSASGAINVVTKSGGNELHGNAFYFRRDDAFDKPNFFSQTVPPFKIQQFGGTVGGPMRRDKAFYFFSYERRADNRSAQVNIPTAIRSFVQGLGYDTRTDVPVINKVNNYYGKLTFNLNPQHSLNVTYLYDDRKLKNQQVSGNSAGDHGYDDNRHSYFLLANLTSLIGNSTVNELRFNRSIQALDRVLPGPPKPELVFPTVSFGQASNIPQARAQKNWIITDAIAHNLTTGWGQHDLKFGFEMNVVPTFTTINQSYNGRFEFRRDEPVVAGNAATLPFRFTQGIELNGIPLSRTEGDNNIYSAFVNDTWQVRKGLTINLGLRYDWQTWRGDINGQDFPTGVSEEAFWVRHITGDLRGQKFKPIPNDLNNFGPRFGFSIDPFRNGRTVIRGGYGFYYDQVTTTTLRSVIRGYPGFVSTSIANDSSLTNRPNSFFPNLPAPNSLPESAGNVFRAASRTAESPYTQQMTGGFQHQLSSDYAVQVDYVRLFGVHFERTRNVNARRADGSYPLIAAGTRLNLLDTSNVIKIHQFQARIEKRFANRYGFLFGYTLGNAKSFDGTPVDNYNFEPDWGPTANDVRHRIVANALVELPLGINFGSILTYNTKAPYNITTGADNNRDGNSNDRPAGVGFNEGRGDDLMTFDLRTTKKFRFREDMSFEVLWEMFNLFNRVNLANFNGNRSSATFGRARTALDPFQAQLGLRFTF